jgi:hypothetical protein
MSPHPDFPALIAALDQAERALPYEARASMPPAVGKEYVGLIEAILKTRLRAEKLQARVRT